MSLYITTQDVNDLQIRILRLANEWARTVKTPVPQKEIVARMEDQKENPFTVVNALNALVRKRYIMRVKVYGSGSKTFYAILRSI